MTTELIVAFNQNLKYIARQISNSKYLELLRLHGVKFQGSDIGTRSELAKVLARKKIILN